MYESGAKIILFAIFDKPNIVNGAKNKSNVVFLILEVACSAILEIFSPR